MNLLFINDIPFNPKCGGIERVTDSLVKEFIHLGYNVYYIFVFPQDHQFDYQFPAPYFIIPRNLEFQEKIEYINDIVNTYKIDIIVNQRGQFPYITKLLINDNVKIINVLHSQPSALIFLYLNKILLRRSKTWKGLLKYCVKCLLYPLLRIIKKRSVFKETSLHYTYLVENSDAIVLLSDSYKNEFLSFLKKKQVRNCDVTSIPNPNTFRSNLPVIEKNKTILYVGRLCKDDKNPLRLLKVWKKIYRKHEDWNIEFVGDGDELKSMREYVAQYNLPRVIFQGSKSSVVEFYQKASIVCLVSNIEGWGMALTEGMQCGCVPVTFNSYGAAKDIIDDGINGCLVEPFRINKYASRLSEIMSSESVRKRMSEAAYNKVYQFDVSVVAGRWDCLFKSVMRNNK